MVVAAEEGASFHCPPPLPSVLDLPLTHFPSSLPSFIHDHQVTMTTESKTREVCMPEGMPDLARRIQTDRQTDRRGCRKGCESNHRFLHCTKVAAPHRPDEYTQYGLYETSQISAHACF